MAQHQSSTSEERVPTADAEDICGVALGTTEGLSLPSGTFFFSAWKEDTLRWKGCLWLHIMGAQGVPSRGFPSLERLPGWETQQAWARPSCLELRMSCYNQQTLARV